MTKKVISAFAKKALICLLAATVAGILLLLAVFALPTEPMLRHVKSTEESRADRAEDSKDNPFRQYIELGRESFTDAIILQNAIERAEGKSIFECAIMVYRHDIQEEFWSPEESLQAVCAGMDTETMYLREYSRYWHGYLVLVKPLLLVLTERQLVIFGGVLQLVLLLVLEIVSIRKKRAGAGIAVLAGWLLMKPVLLAASITMSICWILTLLVLIYMLLHNDRIADRAAYPVLFLLTGLLTAYFDFLTYPVITLGFPLCVYFLLNEETAGTALKKSLGYSTAWGIGYVGIWGMKWVVADLTLHRGTIKDALWTIIGRTEAIGGRPRFNGAAYAIGLNFQEYSHPVFYIIMAVIGVTAIVTVGVACIRRGFAETMRKLLPFAIACIIPFAWITVAQNHSALHARFTFRILSIAFMGIACMGISAFRILHDSKKEERITG